MKALRVLLVSAILSSFSAVTMAQTTTLAPELTPAKPMSSEPVNFSTPITKTESKPVSSTHTTKAIAGRHAAKSVSKKATKVSHHKHHKHHKTVKSHKKVHA